MKNTHIKVGSRIETKDGKGEVQGSWWSAACGEWKHAVRFDSEVKSTVISDPHDLVILESELLPSDQNSGSPASEWQPIATIPKDGTPVLVASPGMARPEIAWHEETGGTMRTYDFWMPLPSVPNVKEEQSQPGTRSATQKGSK